MDFASIKRLGLDHYNIDQTKSYEFYNQDTNNHIIILYLNKDTNLICPYCNRVNIIRKGTRTNTFLYSTPNEKNISISLYKHVYYCSDCKKYFQQKNPFVIQGRTISVQTDIEILNSLKDKTKTYSKVAEEFHVSPTYVINLFDKKVDLKPLQLPEVLAIDEVYSKRLTRTKYCCVLYDPRHRKIVDVIDNRHKMPLIDYFARIPTSAKNKVLFVSIDMYRPYKDVIRTCLPCSMICVDSFHVVKQLHVCFNKIRIRIMKKYEKFKEERSNYYWLLKKYFSFLLMDQSKFPKGFLKVSRNGMSMSADQILNFCLNIDSELKLAYELKEEYREFNFTADFENANEKLNELIFKFKKSQIHEYTSFFHLLENWQEEIVNSFYKYKGKRISNGPMERVNRDIKLLFEISFGSSNFERVRNRILYSINEDSSILSYRKDNTNKVHKKSRGPYKKK